MCYYIGANALIEYLKKNNKRFLTYTEIEDYGSRVVQILNETGEKAILILSRDSTNTLFRNYSNFFVEIEKDGDKGIYLREEIGIKQLIQQFRGYLALDVLLAFVNDRSVSVLGV